MVEERMVRVKNTRIHSHLPIGFRGIGPSDAKKVWPSLHKCKAIDKQELHNLEVMQFFYCPNLTRLCLEGIGSLWHLAVVKLQNLVAVTLTTSLGMAESEGIFKSLQFVVLESLNSLVHGPDVWLCTSLHAYNVMRCRSMTNLDEMERLHLKVFELWGLVACQLKRLLNVTTLHSLEYFYLNSKFCIA